MGSLSNDALMIFLSLIGGFIVKIIWDWLTKQGSEARAVTYVLLDKISKDISIIEVRLDKKFDEIFERLRLCELNQTRTSERLESIATINDNNHGR